MRKSDKKLNMFKVNLLTEQRYLQSKDLSNESIDAPLSYGDKIVWDGEVKNFGNGNIVKPGDIGKYIGKDENGFAVEFNKIFYAGESDFKKL